MRLILALTLAGVSFLLPGNHTLTGGTGAAVCTIRVEEDPRARLDSKLDESSLVLVGVVTAEAAEELSGSVFRSTVRAEAALTGEHDAPEVELPSLSDVWLCGGGPRIKEGNRVLLLLNKGWSSTRNGVPTAVYWETGPVGGNVILRSDGTAMLDDYVTQIGPEYDGDLGDSDTLIHYVAARVGASDESTTAALAALERPVAEERSALSWVLALALTTLIAAGALALLWELWARLPRGTPGA